MNSRLLPLLTRLLNQTLKVGDPYSFEQLNRLAGSRMTVVLSPITLTWQWFVEGGELSVTLDAAEPSDCEVRGSVFVFLRMMQSKTPFQKGDVSIQGDVHVAEQWFAFLKSVKIDWEACFASVMGDVPAVRFMNFCRDAQDDFQRRAKDATEDLEQFLKYEAAYLPTRESVRVFLDDVDDLSLAVDRLSARMAELTKE